MTQAEVEAIAAAVAKRLLEAKRREREYKAARNRKRRAQRQAHWRRASRIVLRDDLRSTRNMWRIIYYSIPVLAATWLYDWL